MEEFGNVKILRTTNPKTVIVDGIKIEIPNDSSYYFENDELQSAVEAESPDIESIKNVMQTNKNFEVENGTWIRKKI